MTIPELMKEAHQNAVDKGWYDGKRRELPELLMMAVTELGEATNEYRSGKGVIYCQYAEHCEGCDNCTVATYLQCTQQNKKPMGIGVEIADCFLRLLDTCGHLGIDIETVLQTKHQYNRTRPYRHGGKIC